MTPASNRLRGALRRHRGWRCLSLVLAFALMCLTWPRFDLHTHADGDRAHTHALEHDHHPSPDDPDAPGVTHVHDASCGSWTLPAGLAPFAAAPLAAWTSAPTFNPGALAARPPPQRPPIV